MLFGACFALVWAALSGLLSAVLPGALAADFPRGSGLENQLAKLMESLREILLPGPRPLPFLLRQVEFALRLVFFALLRMGCRSCLAAVLLHHYDLLQKASSG